MCSQTNVQAAILEVGQRLASRGFIAGADGNISVRLGDGRVMITPAGLAKGRLTSEDLVIVDYMGAVLEGRHLPSSEIRMHLFVYQHRPDIAACVHAHPPYATAFAVAGRSLTDDVLPEIVLAVGRVPLTEYGATGTDEVPKALAPSIDGCDAFLLRNHGLLTIGRTLEEAYNRHETVEHYARIVHLASQMGSVSTLSADELRRLEAIRLANRSRGHA